MISDSLLEILRAAVRAEAAGFPKVTVAYSGGLDSSIVAALVSEVSIAECVTSAVDGSFDALNSEQRAAEEGLHTRLIRLRSEDLKEMVREASRVLQTVDPVPIAYTLPLLSVAQESTAPNIFAGNGADELFGGYAKYSSFEDPTSAMSTDTRKMIDEIGRLRKWAEENGKRLSFPFARKEVMSFSASLPITEKIAGGQRKIILKEVGKLLNLPSHERPKKAAQYSSGALRLMQKSARLDGLTLADWTRNAAEGC